MGVVEIILLAVAIILAALAVVLAPKPPAPPSAELATQEVPRNDPSKYLGVGFGRFRVKDPIVAWFGNTSATPIMSDQAGKK